MVTPKYTQATLYMGSDDWLGSNIDSGWSIEEEVTR